jgi:hypothetical protein
MEWYRRTKDFRVEELEDGWSGIYDTWIFDYKCERCFHDDYEVLEDIRGKVYGGPRHGEWYDREVGEYEEWFDEDGEEILPE